MARIAKPAKYGQKTGAGIENTASVSAGIWASVAQKVVLHNNHLKREFYNQYDQRLTRSALFSRLIAVDCMAGKPIPKAGDRARVLSSLGFGRKVSVPGRGKTSGLETIDLRGPCAAPAKSHAAPCSR